MYGVSKRVLLISSAFIALTTATFGCAFSKNKNKPTNQILTTASPEQISASDVKIEIKETEDFNRYFAEFNWPKGKGIRLEVRDVDFIFNSDDSEKLKIPLEGGEVKKLEVAAYNKLGGNIYRQFISITTPKDYVVRENETLPADTEWTFNRIKIPGKSTIHLNGHNLKMNADRVYFEAGATIDSDGENRFAPTPEKLAGVRIAVNARQAFGHVRVFLEGFNGKDGRSGAQIDKESNFVDALNAELKGAPGRAASSRFRRCENDCYHCDAEATDGGPGKPGAPGTDGEDGQPGGNTGSLHVAIAEPKQSSLSIEVIARPGRPGRGGEGGIGRRGGEGGNPGARADGCDYKPRRGPEGPRGPKGADGKDGNPGSIGSISATPGVDLRIRD